MNYILHLSCVALIEVSECRRLTSSPFKPDVPQVQVAERLGVPNFWPDVPVVRPLGRPPRKSGPIQTCEHPLRVGIKNFTAQCDGSCKRATQHHQQQIASGTFREPWAPTKVVDSEFSDVDASFMERRFHEKYECVARPISEKDVWTIESFFHPSERRLAFNDRQLLEAMSLSLQVSAFEDTQEGERLIDAIDEDDPESRERALNEAYGTGTRRTFEGHVVNGGGRLFAIASLRGKHLANEDASWWVNLPDIAAFGVFDGHDGSDASDRSAHMVLQKLPVLWLTHMRYAERGTHFWAESIRKAFSETQQHLLNLNVRGGTTASVIHVNKSSGATVIAWVGDTRVMHARPDQKGRWQLQWLSAEHHCDVDEGWINMTANKKEIKCTSVAGGKSYASKGPSRVGITRSLGDYYPFKDGLLLSTPQVHELQVESGDILLAASDGLWDVVEIADVLDALRLNNQKAVVHLMHKARLNWKDKQINYQDDISVVLWRADVGRAPKEPDPGYHLSESTGAWLVDGDVGDRCEQLEKMTLTHKLGQGLRQGLRMKPAKDSTCGRIRPVAHKSPFGIVTRSEEQLKCFIPFSHEHPKKGGFGVCAIGLYQACGTNSHGCREGIRCRSHKFYDPSYGDGVEETYECS